MMTEAQVLAALEPLTRVTSTMPVRVCFVTKHPVTGRIEIGDGRVAGVDSSYAYSIGIVHILNQRHGEGSHWLEPVFEGQNA